MPFRGWCCEQYLTFSSRRGARQLGYAGLAGRFVSGFVGNLLRFLPDGGATNLVTPAWRVLSQWFCEKSLAFSPGGGAANLVTPAWRAVSCVVL